MQMEEKSTPATTTRTPTQQATTQPPHAATPTPVRVTVKPKADPHRTMLATAWYGTEDVRVVRVPVPDITDPTDCIVRNTSVTICGSDLHMSHTPRTHNTARPSSLLSLIDFPPRPSICCPSFASLSSLP